MMRIILFLLCFIVHSTAGAQTEITELKKELATAGHDSVKLSAYRKLFKYYQYSHTDSAMQYLTQAHEAFRKSGYKTGIAQVVSMQASIYELKGIDDWARKKYIESMALFGELKDDNGLANANSGLGKLEGKAGNFDEATKYFHTSLKLFEKVGNTNSIVSSYINLGRVNSMSEHFDIALINYNKALEILRDQPVRPNTVLLYNNIGTVYAQQGMFDSALHYFNKSLDMCRQKGFTMLLMDPLNNIGNIYRMTGRADMAMKYYNEALAVAVEVAPPDELIRIRMNLAKMKAETNPKEAVAMLTPLLDSAVKIGQKLLELDVLSTLIEVNRSAGNYKDAMYYVERNTQLSDSLFNIEKSEQLQMLQTAYETDKANEKISQLEISEAASTRNKNISIIIAITLLVLLLAITFFYGKSRRLNVQLTKANTDKDRLFSIIGHDLRGPVANIPMMVDLCRDDITSEEEKEFLLNSLKKNAEATIETLEKLLSWGKTHIKNAQLHPTTFDVNTDIVNNIELLKGAADQKNIRIINNVPDGVLIHAEAEHFRFVMRNLLSNAVKFTPTAGTITVNAENDKPGRILFSVTDTGVGISKERQKNIFTTGNESTPGTANEVGTGLGLMLCEKFVKENGGQIWVESEEGKGTTFYFTFKASALRQMVA